MSSFVLIGAFLTGMLVCSYIDTRFLELQNVKILPQKTLDRIKYDATDAFGRASYTVGFKSHETASKLREALQDNAEIVANKFLLFFGQEPDINKKLTDLKSRSKEFQELSKTKIKTVFTILMNKLKSILHSAAHFLRIDTGDSGNENKDVPQ